MAQVYGSSMLTIAASASPGPTHGILKSSISLASRHGLTATTKRCGQGTIFVEPRLMDWHEAVQSYAGSSLASRAWVLQEQVLSPRTIHFTEDQVYWECRISRLGQATGVVPPFRPRNSDGSDVGGLYRFWEINKALILPLVQGDPRTRATRWDSSGRSRTIVFETQHLYHMFWQALVEQYTTRKLTKGRDILPAISALASIFQPSLNGATYLAGLWEPFLMEGLSWRLFDEPDAHANYQEEIGHEVCKPSWSWISVPRRVMFYQPYEDEDPKSHYRAQVLHARAEPQDPSRPLGEILGAFLRVRGLSTYVRIEGDPAYQGSNTISRFWLPVPYHDGNDEDCQAGEAMLRFHIPHPSYPGMLALHREPIYPLQDDGSLLYQKITYDDDEDAVGFTCILDRPCERDRSAPGTWLSFRLLRVYDRAYLLLQKCEDGSDRYRRIGLAVNTLSWEDPTWDEVEMECTLV